MTPFRRRVAAGLGLEQRGDAVMVDRAGLLRFRAPNKLWVETDGSVVRE